MRKEAMSAPSELNHAASFPDMTLAFLSADGEERGRLLFYFLAVALWAGDARLLVFCYGHLLRERLFAFLAGITIDGH